MTHKKTCGTCRFFDDDPTYKHPDCDGSCHLNPPIIIPNSRGEHVLMFIPTDQDSWCGQWEPNEDEMSAVIDGLLGAILGSHEEAKEESEAAPEPEDSWEKLREDAQKLSSSYWGCAGMSCENCPAKIEGELPADHYGVYSCIIAEQMDILARAEKLAGVSEDE